MADFLRYILFRTEAWTVTGALLMTSIYLSQVLDPSRPRDNAGMIAGTMVTGIVLAGLFGGACSILWQLMRLMTGRPVPAAPMLLKALAAARPGMIKGAVIGFIICYVIGLVMTSLFILTKEPFGVWLGSRIAWQFGCGIAGGALGTAIASIGGLARRV